MFVWHDARTLDGPQNMATDEVLLRSKPKAPVLRIYGWDRPTISIGYFQSIPELEGAEIVRRWTGGGLVDHRSDLTYSLIIPRSEAFASERPQVSYAEIHAVIRDALVELGFAAELAEAEKSTSNGGCFAGGWAEGDVICSGRKVAGAAQRRCRFGVLHQGSIHAKGLDDPFWNLLAAKMTVKMLPFTLDPALEPEMEALASERYASPDWLHKRPVE
tara:strand:- start:443 stop:1093 length:651 start_codon:yes stop_codon:yes gene_type:complete